jgi:hypothetical protein
MFKPAPLIIAAPLCAALLCSGANAATPQLESRLFVNEKCPSRMAGAGEKNGAFGSALLSVLAGPLVDAAVDLGVNAISKAAEDKAVDLPPASLFGRFYSTGATGLHQVHPDNLCITLVAGNFGPKAEGEQPAMPLWLVNAIPRLNKSGLQGAPALYFEAEIVVSDDRKHFALHPRAVYIGQFQQSSSWGRDKRKFDIGLAFQDIESTQAYASFQFSYPDVEPGYARLACAVGEKPLNYPECKVDGAGATKGWFQMQPETTGMLKLSTARKHLAARLGGLLPSPQVVYQTAPDLVLENVLSSAGDKYCRELDKDNARLPEKLRRVDELCPVALRSSQEVSKADLALRQRKLDYVDAYMLYQEECMKKVYTDAPKDRKTLYEKFSTIPETKEADIKACVQLQPPVDGGEFTLSATVVETRPGSRFAKWFAPVAKSASGDIKTLIKNELPQQRKEEKERLAKAASEKAALDRLALQTLKVVDLEVTMAQNNLDKAESTQPRDDNDVLGKQILLLKKQFEANNAYRAAGLDPRYPDVP